MNSVEALCIGITLLILGTGLGEEVKELETPYSASRDLQARSRKFGDAGEYGRALAELDFADSLTPRQADIHNARGCLYLEAKNRDLALAAASFKIALELKPNWFPPRFNLAEIDYVAGNWSAAEVAFREILVGYPKLDSSIQYLIRFKVVASLVKQRKTVDAVIVARSMYGLRLKIPGYYFAMGVIAIATGEKITAADYLLATQRNFKMEARTAYMDSLIEGGFIAAEAAKEGKFVILPQ